MHLCNKAWRDEEPKELTSEYACVFSQSSSPALCRYPCCRELTRVVVQAGKMEKRVICKGVLLAR